jgi:hypothetical protein
MTEHENVTKMRQAYAAFGKGDFDALTELWAEDIRWHEPGHTAFAGTYVGPQSIFEMFGKIMEMTEGSFRVEPLTLLADDNWAVAVVTTTAHRGGKTLETLSSHLTRMVDGRAVEFWDTETEPDTMDEFFA